MSNFSAYRIMWVMVFFDLPVETAEDRKIATKFRKDLLKDGFSMFQFSIYLRHCHSQDNAEVHQRRVKASLPKKGMVGVMTITDRQFGMMELFYGTERQSLNPPSQQLELF